MLILQAMALSFLPSELVISTLVALSLYLYMKFWRLRNPLYPVDWPVVGVLPFLMSRLHNIHDELTVVLASSGCNFKAQGPLASGMRFFFTADPSNVRHIFTSNHANYPKGEEFAEIFDIFSGSILTIDGEACRQQRGMFQSILSNPRFLATMASCCRDKVVNGLLPFLTRMSSMGTPFDMQELITRLVFDLTARPIFGVDPGCLSISMPPMRVATAMDTVMEVALFRHTIPVPFWKVMRRLNLGPERKMAVAHTVLHGFVREMTEKWKIKCADLDNVAALDILSVYPVDTDDFLLSKILLNYMIAGRDTVGTALPWVFYNLAKNPHVVSCIRKEMAPVAALKATALASNGTSDMVFFEPEETKALVYLQAAVFESLRLYPPGPIERKTVLADDVLPSGHQLRSGETILVSIYAMGRMESLWSRDCHEYRPERWLSEDGEKLRYVPSHKFMAFNSGPRMCLGKDIAIAQMTTIIAAVVWNFDMEVLGGQTIQPKMSCILQLKNGLTMTVKQRGA
jgi:cytochrome P450